MARIVVQALHSDGRPRRWTLSERIVAENLDNDHYTAQLLERLSWATADAEAWESSSGRRATSASAEEDASPPTPPSAEVPTGPPVPPRRPFE